MEFLKIFVIIPASIFCIGSFTYGIEKLKLKNLALAIFVVLLVLVTALSYALWVSK